MGQLKFSEADASLHQDLSEMVYGVLKWFVIENKEGQLLLEEDDPCVRAERLLRWMRFFLKEAQLHWLASEPIKPQIPKVKKEDQIPPAKTHAEIITVDFRGQRLLRT
jgi:hypothetical protein